MPVSLVKRPKVSLVKVPAYRINYVHPGRPARPKINYVHPGRRSWNLSDDVAA